jgi:hypothetical protein
MIGLSGQAIGADSSPAGDAIKEAIAVLKARKAKIGGKADQEKVQAAIDGLEQLLKEGGAEKASIADLIDNTEKYKGTTITLMLRLNTNPGDTLIDGAKGQSLQQFVGSDVQFFAIGPKRERLDIVISLPAGLVVPKAVSFDDLVVTFKCTKGDLRKGNEAVSIKRP